MLTPSQILLLNELPGVGVSTVRALAAFLTASNEKLAETPGAIVELFERLKKEKPRVKVPTSEDIDQARRQRDQVLEASAKAGVRMLTAFDPLYPQLFHDLTDKPLLIHYLGILESLQRPTVAVIGTREPSSHVLKAGPKLSDYFVETGFTIVSGLALGCDTVGHLSAVSAGKPTVAVMAGGLHEFYPKENKQLAAKILETGGLLLSELPFGRHPNRNTFVERDRLQSGLSYGVVVLETGIKGGTLHTVGFAEKQQRAVACMYSHYHVGLQDHEKFQGNKMLVEAGRAFALDRPEAIYQFMDLLQQRWAADRPLPDKPSGPSQLSIF